MEVSLDNRDISEAPDVTPEQRALPYHKIYCQAKVQISVISFKSIKANGKIIRESVWVVVNDDDRLTCLSGGQVHVVSPGDGQLGEVNPRLV